MARMTLKRSLRQLAVGDALLGGGQGAGFGNFSPESVGGTTVRMLLVVDDPDEMFARAVAAGATEVSPVEDEHGWRLGRIDDPFGHRWEIGKPLNEWPPTGDRHD